MPMSINLNKEQVLKRVIEELEAEVTHATQAAKTAANDATGEESRPENEYDTRALEASYVARGQAKRVAYLKEILHDIKLIPLRYFRNSDKVGITSLVQMQHEAKKLLAFVLPKGGGFFVEVSGEKIQIVTPNTPLGEALLGAEIGEELVIEVGNKEKVYEILNQI